MPVIYEPALANPAPYGLYGTATVLETPDPNRFGFDGLLVRSLNCGPSGVWPYGYCEDPGEATKGGERADDLSFAGLVVWAADDCGLLADHDEQLVRARQIMRLHEHVRVEEHLAGVLAAAAVPTPAADLTAALGVLEEAIGGYGFTGVVHAPAHLAAPAAAAQLIVREGPRLLTPLGHRWAFGTGYDGDTLYGTGPVVIHRGPVVESTGPAHRTNERLVVVEREVLVSWECFTVAVAIA